MSGKCPGRECMMLIDGDDSFSDKKKRENLECKRDQDEDNVNFDFLLFCIHDYFRSGKQSINQLETSIMKESRKKNKKKRLPEARKSFDSFILILLEDAEFVVD